MEQSKTNLNLAGVQSLPILGKAVPTKKNGYYGVLNSARIGTEYAIICPKCGKTLRFMADKARLYTLPCDKCDDVVIIVKAVEQELQQTDGKGQPMTAPNPQQQVGTISQNETTSGLQTMVQPDTSQVAGNGGQGTVGPQKLTKKYKNKGYESNAKLVWWSISGRKQYILREGKNYIGRKDEDMPSDLSLKDEFASARSVCIEATKRDKGYIFHLTVERASNPVLVCGKECPVGTGFDLNYNDTIRLGNTTLTLKLSKK